MKTDEINIRDPFVLVHNGQYYLYGTRSATCWGPAEGFDCYVSPDLENWQGPLEIFHRPRGFFADREYWAPECVYYRDAFTLITTLGGEGRKKGIYALRSPSPTGPFVPVGERLTPEDWTCIDGTVWFEDGHPWLIFSHSFEDTPDGDMCLLRLNEDLTGSPGKPQVLFSAGEAPWARPVPFARAEFGMEGDVYFTDGPCLADLGDGRLAMTWSSWSTHGYAVGVAVSDSGKVSGPWRQAETPLYPENGGHGSLFRDLAGNRRFVLHSPNDRFKERPVFLNVETAPEGLRLIV